MKDIIWCRIVSFTEDDLHSKSGYQESFTGDGLNSNSGFIPSKSAVHEEYPTPEKTLHSTPVHNTLTDFLLVKDNMCHHLFII